MIRRSVGNVAMIAVVVSLMAAAMTGASTTGALAQNQQARQAAVSQFDPLTQSAVVLLFSRNEIGNAVPSGKTCVPDLAPGAVWFDNRVMPELTARGMKGVFTVETDLPGATTRPCLHYNRTIAMSWADLAHYHVDFGWEAVSHGQTRVAMTSLTPAQVTQQLVTSRDTLVAHGFDPTGMFAYQNNRYNDTIQTEVAKYYDFGRIYKYPVTTAANSFANVDPQRYMWTSPAGGGHCTKVVPACTSNNFTSNVYKRPSTFVTAINALLPGQVLVLQSYVFVEGSRAGQWDCTSADEKTHWTFDAERYCWSDYLTILNALSARTQGPSPSLVVTDPKTIARAWYPSAPTTP